MCSNYIIYFLCNGKKVNYALNNGSDDNLSLQIIKIDNLPKKEANEIVEYNFEEGKLKFTDEDITEANESGIWIHD